MGRLAAILALLALPALTNAALTNAAHGQSKPSQNQEQATGRNNPTSGTDNVASMTTTHVTGSGSAPASTRDPLDRYEDSPFPPCAPLDRCEDPQFYPGTSHR
jgi:hypothetical protein